MVRLGAVAYVPEEESSEENELNDDIEEAMK